jgi:DNA-binding NarL/FixJ family response regulator
MRAETRETLHRNEDNHLTPREREISRLVAQGLRNKEVASALGVSTATIKAHLGTIYVKLKLKGRVRLALFVRETAL